MSDFSTLSTALADRRHAAELQLAAAVLADPGAGISAAEAAGISPDHFQSNDLRLIYCACLVQRQYSPGDALALAYAALQADHLIDDLIPTWKRGPIWSAHALDSFARDFFSDGQGPSVAGAAMIALAIPIMAVELLDIDRRQVQAIDHFNQAERLLDGSAETSRNTPATPIVILRRAS